MGVKQLSDKIFQRMLDKGLVMIEISARHVHLTQDDVDQLFGEGHQLTCIRELSQKGQFLSEERVNITGSKGTLKNVAILGPCRNLTQIELSSTDVRTIGINASVCLSGNTKNTPGATISVGSNSIQSNSGVIIAQRHIHMSPTDAKRLNVFHGDSVHVKIFSDHRAITFEDTIIRVDKNSSLAMHIDIEEANAAGISKLGYGLIKKV